MLSILLLLAAAPQSVIPSIPAPPQAVAEAEPRLGDLAIRVPGWTPRSCRSEKMRASDTIGAEGGLMWREGGEPVGLYRLLDRRVDGCPAPIMVLHRVPGSNALGPTSAPSRRVASTAQSTVLD